MDTRTDLVTNASFNGQFILHTNPWIRRTTFPGLVLFVFLPGPATGSTGASILGRLLGMSRLGTFVAIVLGSLLGCAGYYLGAELIRPYIARENRAFVIGGVAVLVGLVLLLNYRYRQLKSRYLTTHPIAESLQKLGYADEAESYVRRANQLKSNDLEQTS